MKSGPPIPMSAKQHDARQCKNIVEVLSAEMQGHPNMRSPISRSPCCQTGILYSQYILYSINYTLYVATNILYIKYHIKRNLSEVPTRNPKP